MDAPDAPELTEVSLSNGLPGVEVYFPTLDSDAVRITVWRLADGTREAVRGMENRTVAGDFVETDWEVPFGVPSTYVAEIFDADGAAVTGAQGVIQVDCDDVWFQDQVDPELSFKVSTDAAQLLQGSVDQIVRTRQTSKQFVFGESRPFLQNFGLGGLENIRVELLTETQQQMQALLGMTRVSPILVRTPPVFASLPRVLSADVPQPSGRPLFQGRGDAFTHVWLLVMDEVQPISKALLKPLVTWEDWEEAFPADDFTWEDVELLYSAGTWTDAVRNPPNA